MSRLVVFLTNGAGLADWDRVGTLERELAIYRRLFDAGWSISFQTYDRSPDLPQVGFPAEVRAEWPFVLPRRLRPIYWALSPLLRQPPSGAGPKVVLTNQAHSGWPALIASARWGAPLVARCGYVFGESAERLHLMGLATERKKIAERITFQRADRCVVPTEELADWVRDRYRIAWDRIVVIPNYVDCAQFKPAERKPDVDVLSIGRLIEKKRHDLLLRALEGTGLRVRIIGAGTGGPRLRALARELGVELELSTRVEHRALPEILNGARVFVILSRWEGHPKALIEAMACGRPCIGARSPGIENLIEDGRTGMVVDPEPAEVKRAILGLLSDSARSRELGRRAQRVAESRFSLERVFDRYRALLGGLIHDGRR